MLTSFWRNAAESWGLIMLPDSYISGIEQEKLQSIYCAKIVSYNEFRKKMRAWYQEFDFEFRDASENNFRDSWFHYRKLYQERSAYEIVCQIANFEEHLQRAEKDTIIYFLQKTSALLEVWYLQDAIEKESFLSDESKNKAVEIYADVNSSKDWMYSLKNVFSDFDEYISACVYIVQTCIVTAEFRREVQKYLHKIKNVILEIRSGGAEIQRMKMPGDCFQKCECYFEELLKLCRKYRIKVLLSMTEEIEVQLYERGV